MTKTEVDRGTGSTARGDESGKNMDVTVSPKKTKPRGVSWHAWDASSTKKKEGSRQLEEQIV